MPISLDKRNWAVIKKATIVTTVYKIISHDSTIGNTSRAL